MFFERVFVHKLLKGVKVKVVMDTHQEEINRPDKKKILQFPYYRLINRIEIQSNQKLIEQCRKRKMQES